MCEQSVLILLLRFRRNKNENIIPNFEYTVRGFKTPGCVKQSFTNLEIASEVVPLFDVLTEKSRNSVRILPTSECLLAFVGEPCCCKRAGIL